MTLWGKQIPGDLLNGKSAGCARTPNESYKYQLNKYIEKNQKTQLHHWLEFHSKHTLQKKMNEKLKWEFYFYLSKERK